MKGAGSLDPSRTTQARDRRERAQRGPEGRATRGLSKCFQTVRDVSECFPSSSVTIKVPPKIKQSIVTHETFTSLCEEIVFPVNLCGTLYWADEISEADLDELIQDVESGPTRSASNPTTSRSRTGLAQQ